MCSESLLLQNHKIQFGGKTQVIVQISGCQPTKDNTKFWGNSSSSKIKLIVIEGENCEPMRSQQTWAGDFEFVKWADWLDLSSSEAAQHSKQGTSLGTFDVF